MSWNEHAVKSGTRHASSWPVFARRVEQNKGGGCHGWTCIAHSNSDFLLVIATLDWEMWGQGLTQLPPFSAAVLPVMAGDKKESSSLRTQQ